MRASVSGGMTCARSVTKPRGAGIAGSAAGAGRVRAPTRSAAMTSGLRTERVDRSDDSLDVGEIGAELGAESHWVEDALPCAMREEPAERRQRPQRLLARRERVGIGASALHPAQAEEMAQHHHEDLERLDHELLDRLGSPGSLEEERAQPEEFAAGLVLALAPERRGIELECGEHVGAGEKAVLPPDVLQLHRERVAGAGQVFL